MQLWCLVWFKARKTIQETEFFDSDVCHKLACVIATIGIFYPLTHSLTSLSEMRDFLTAVPRLV